MVQYLKVGILSMNAEDNYLLHRVALHACRINLHAPDFVTQKTYTL